MTMRQKWQAIPGFFALAAAATVVSAYSGASSSQYRSPEQPVHFPHPRHAGAVNLKNPKQGGLGMNCLYCHYASNKSPDAGMPAVGTCMGCHTVVLGQRSPAELKKDPQLDTARQNIVKLTSYWNKKLPVPWIRIHKVPDYVNFPHMRHVNAGVTCQTCHGKIQGQWQVQQAASLNMGWCINCHVNGYKPGEGARLAGAPDSVIQAADKLPVHKARYDCSSCHY